MVAAATTSLPERAEQGRNYDYRYAWIRDQCFAGQAVAAAGGGDLLDSAVALRPRPAARRRRRSCVPAYTVDGGPGAGRSATSTCPATRARRTSERATRSRGQFQLDAFGEALLLSPPPTGSTRSTPTAGKAAEVAVDAIAQRYDEPDAGIWELDDRALDPLPADLRRRAARRRGPSCRTRAADWAGLADRIAGRRRSQDCLHPDGRWQRAPDDPAVDAALLLPGAPRGRPGRRPAHRRAPGRPCVDELGRRRLRLPVPPAAGARCTRPRARSCCAASTWRWPSHQQGDAGGAVRWFERNRGALGPPGLFTEEFDVVQRQLRGNLPQAFVHALLHREPPTP